MSHSPFHGWRTRLFHVTRNPITIIKISAAIMLAGFSMACVLVYVNNSLHPGAEKLTPWMRILQEKLDLVDTEPQKSRALASWLRLVTAISEVNSTEVKVTKPTIDSYENTGEVLGFPVHALIFAHVPDEAGRGLFEDYVRARLQRTDARAVQARKRLDAAAIALPPVPMANGFVGDLLVEDGDQPGALAAYRREGKFADAKHARDKALMKALEIKDIPALRDMMADPVYASEASPWVQNHAGLLLNDWSLIVHGFMGMETQRERPEVLIVAAFAALLWYAVFVRCGVRERWRWVRPLPAVLAGVASVFPTLLLLEWQESSTGLKETGEFVHDLIFYVMSVGLREELSKLALFALFIPWLLKQRSPGKALLVGAFVGLGFAMDENRLYYTDEGIATAAVGRVLTANFFHAALTGLAGHALYELVRTKFGSAEKFLVTVVGVILAHGLYDWVQSAGSANPIVGDIGLFSLLTLAAVAQQFFDKLASLIQPQRGIVSLLFLFLVGLATLVSAGFVLAAVESGTLQAVAAVGADVVSLVPIVVFYVRKFGHL